MKYLSSQKLSLLLPAALAFALSLACSRFPLGGTPIPGPSTVAAGITQTFMASQGESEGTPAPGQSDATPRPTEPAPSNTPAGGADEGRPRLAAGQPINLVRIDMLDPNHGWAVGHAANDPGEYLLRTADGGQTWADVSPPVEPGAPWAAAAFFLDDAHAWATFADPAAPPLTGEPVLVWRTTNAGQTWAASQPLNLGEVEHNVPSDLVFADERRGWLLTHVGAGMNHDYVVLFITSDGGQSWERIADPLSTSPTNLPMSCRKTGLHFLSADTGWVTGDCQGVAPGLYFHRSDDAGRSWQPQALPPPPGASDLFANETLGCGTYSPVTLAPQFVSVAVVCTDFVNSEVNVWLYRSDDAGQNWQASPLPGRDLFFLDATTAWSVAEADVNQANAPRLLYTSTDGGATWDPVSTVAWTPQLDFVSPDLGWAIARAGDERAFVATTDGGATWVIVEPTIGS